MYILEAIQTFLGNFWQLTYKKGSTAVCACRGNPNPCPKPYIWPLQQTLNILGHLVGNDGGIKSDVKVTIRAMWRAFWGNAGSKHACKCAVSTSLGLVNRVARGVFEWKCSRLPFQKSAAVQLDQVQNAILSCSQNRAQAYRNHRSVR